MNEVRVHGKNFKVFIEEKQILQRVKEMARQIVNEHRGQNLLFLAVLNGSYVFAADLLRNIEMDVELSFLKLSSYSGVKSTGEVRRLIGLNEDLGNKTVIIIEDIIDTGQTLDGVIEDLHKQGAGIIKIASLLFKPDAYKGSQEIDYLGFEIPNDFVIGYGLDYDGLGRNLRSVYRIAEDQN